MRLNSHRLSHLQKEEFKESLCVSELRVGQGLEGCLAWNKAAGTGVFGLQHSCDFRAAETSPREAEDLAPAVMCR